MKTINNEVVAAITRVPGKMMRKLAMTYGATV
jgi:hypothetical protein